MIEVTLSALVLATVLVASARAFASSVSALRQARRMTSAAIFLGTVMEDLSAQPYDNLLSLNGNEIFDGTNPADSSYAVDLTVFPVQVDLIQIQAELSDLSTNRAMARVTSLRSRR